MAPHPIAVGDGIDSDNARWVFSGSVAANFGSHVRRSIPYYVESHRLGEQLSDFFVHKDSLIYDLGCSLGELSERLAIRHRKLDNVRIVGFDNEPDMVRRSRERLEQFDNVTVELTDLTTVNFAPTDLIAAYYVLQFVYPRQRQDVLNRIYEALNWGGGFLWFEKVRGPDARFQDILTLLYQEHKLESGFTPAEIVAKARSLKGILEPFSSRANQEMLERAGFVDIVPVFRYLCFEGVLAIK